MCRFFIFLFKRCRFLLAFLLKKMWNLPHTILIIYNRLHLTRDSMSSLTCTCTKCRSHAPLVRLMYEYERGFLLSLSPERKEERKFDTAVGCGSPRSSTGRHPTCLLPRTLAVGLLPPSHSAVTWLVLVERWSAFPLYFPPSSARSR